jgi:hypothetical protein
VAETPPAAFASRRRRGLTPGDCAARESVRQHQGDDDAKKEELTSDDGATLAVELVLKSSFPAGGVLATFCFLVRRPVDGPLQPKVSRIRVLRRFKFVFG